MEDIVENAKKGNHESFSKLIDNIQIELYNIARIKLDNEDDVKDVLQETILDIYKGIRKLKDNKLFKTWAVRILLNNCNNILRQKYKKDNIISIEEYSDRYNLYSDNSTEKLHFKLDYEKILKALSNQERLIFIMYYQEDYKIKEISEILQMNDNTIKSILKRGRMKIKSIYKEEIK